MENDKQYGIYTGFLSEESIDKIINGTELELYFIINSIGGMIWRTNHDAADGRINITGEMNKELSEAQYAIEFAVLKTKRFGVEIPEPKNGEHIERTNSYSKWFKWWGNYIQNELSNEEYKKLEQLMESNKDYSMYRLKGTWKPIENANTNIEKLKKYEDVRSEIWSKERRLETRKIQAINNETNQEYETFLNPVNNYNDDVCLYNINDKKDFKVITCDEFNSNKYNITNYDELVNQV